MINAFWTFICGWLEAYNCVLLFGLFYGFLSTLPLSPAQIYFARSFILEHDTRKTSEFKRKYLGQEKGLCLRESQVIFSGSLLAQAIVFFSIYCAPIYGGFFKPHVMLLIAPPTIYAIISKYILEGTFNSKKLLLIGIVLQLMNPILFYSNSTFTRLINLLLFRYTENLVFLISVFIGWLSGQIFFIKLAKFFCLRIERDSELLRSKYATSKRYIREAVKILFCGYFILFCFSGNIPNFLFTKRFKEELFGKNVLVEPFSTAQKSIRKLREKGQGKKTRLILSTKSSDKKTSNKKKKPVGVPVKSEAEADNKVAEIEDEEPTEEEKAKRPYPIEYAISPWMGKPWPNLFYDYRRWNWPIRYISVDPENIVQGHFLGPLKDEVTDYFFDTCISDGESRLSFTSSPSLSWSAEMIRQKLRHSESVSGSEIDCSDQDNFDKWIAAKTSRRDYLNSELEDRVKALSNGSPILDVMEKRVKFSTGSGTCLPEIEDPFLSGPFRGIMEHSRSGWIPLSRNISDEDRLVQELSERLKEEEEPRTPEEKQQKKLTSAEINDFLNLLKKKKRLEQTRTKFIKAKEMNFLVNTVVKKLKKLIQFSNKLCLLFDESKFSFLEEHGKNERVSNTPEEEQIYDQREGEDIIQIMEELMDEFSLFIKKKEKKNSNITGRDVIGNLKEGSLSGKDAFGKFIDEFFFFVENKLSFLDESGKNEQNSDQKKEDEDFDKGVSAPILFFPENKKVKLIFKFWLPLFDLVRRRKVELDKLEKLFISETKAGKAIDRNIYAFFNKIFFNELKLSEIKRDVPFWASKLLTGVYDDYGERKDLDVGSPEIRSAFVLDPKEDDIPIVSWIWETDDDRNIIKGSIRAQRRNLNTWMVMDPFVRSSFFVRYCQMGVKSEEKRRKSKRRDKIKVKFYAKANWFKHSRRPLRKMYQKFLTRAEHTRLAELTWMDEEFFQFVRSFLLVTLIYIRKFIIIPLFGITKNIVRILLFQVPEWKEDWDDWTKEMYVICDYDGVEYSETEYPEDFWEVGVQIKILSPFRFKPWHEGQSEVDAGYLTMNPIVLTEKPFSDTAPDEKRKKEDLSQVLWDEFLGPIRRFWGPRIKQMIRRINELMRPVIGRVKGLIRHIKESTGPVIGRVKGLIKRFIKFDKWIRHIKEWIGRVVQRTRKLIRHIKESVEQILERIKKLMERVIKGMKWMKWMKKSELQPDNKEIDDELEMNDQVHFQLQIKAKPRVQDKSKPRVKDKSNSRVKDKFVIETRLNGKERNEETKVKQRNEETKVKQRNDETRVRERNYEIKQITEKYLLNLETHAKLKKEIDQYSYDIGSGLKNKLVQDRIREITARKRSVRFDIERNSRYLKKLFLRRKLLVIKFKLNFIHLIDSIFYFLNLSRKKIEAIIKNASNIILIPKKKQDSGKKQDFKIGPEKISQAYVLHKMWQIRTMNKSYAKDLLKSRKSSPLIKKNIKELLDIQGILESKQPQDLKMDHWKQWLNFCYGYRVRGAKTKGSLFSQIWSRIAPQKRGNKLSNQCRSKREFESFIGMLQKWNKRYRYDLLAYNYLDSEKEHIHRHLVQDMVVRDIPDHLNTNKKTRKSLVSNFFTLDKSDLKLHKAKLNKTELGKSDKKSNKELDKSDEKSNKKLDKSDEKSNKELDKSDEKSNKELDKEGKSKAIGTKKSYYIDIFADGNETDQVNEKETDQVNEIETDLFLEIEPDPFNEKETDQSLDGSESNIQSNESKTDIKSNESKMDLNKKQTDGNLLIEFLDGYKFLKSYWFFPIFAENLELSEVIQTIRSDLTPLIEYCEMRLSVDQYLSELNSYYSELCKERRKKVKDHDKINEIRNNLKRLNASLDKLSPRMDNFIKKAYAKSDLKLPWLKPEVSFKLKVKKKISKKLLEKETKPPILGGTETTLEETEAAPETKTQLIREEISKLIREREQGLKQPTTAEENEIQAECKAFYEVPLRDYLRKVDQTTFIPLNKVMEKERLTIEIIKYKEKLADAIDAFHFLCTKRDGMSELDFWKSALWKKFNHILNEVAELDRFPTIQLNKHKTFSIAFSELKKAIEKQPEKQSNEKERKKERDDSDKNAYNELNVQLNPGWEKRDNKNVSIQNRVGAKMNAERISRNGGLPLLKEEVWFLFKYEYVASTLEYLLFSEADKAESEKSKSEKSKSEKSKSEKSKSDEAKSDEAKPAEAKPAEAKPAEDEKVHAKRRKAPKEATLSARAIRHLHKICNINDAKDAVVFLHKFYYKKYPEIMRLENLRKEKQILAYVDHWLTFNDCPHHWALLGCNDDRSLVDQMLFNMWLDPLVCLSVVSKDIQVLKLNNRIREGLYVDLSDRSARSILNEKISSSLIFEDILLPRRRREFRILNRLNLENNLGEGSTGYSDGKQYVQNDEELMEKDQCLGIDTTQKMKRFLWPRYRVEDLICMNRYWWNSNRSRSVLKVRMYPKMENWNSWDNFLCLITKYMKWIIGIVDRISYFFLRST
uniref:Protein TIC 214 n=1 Tax=Pherosphaera fitzgeraldii TaxID=56896 RepID=A0A3Q9WRZ4_9CONI|nr:hypothetical protein RF1 [Pherosphaera fitzgeraldii]BBF91055.1 hypothetical protein [Pherosphaera fitzgeraldii]